MVSRFASFLLFLSSAIAGRASEPFHAWAERPVMGWNSWDYYGTAVNEEQTKAHADYMAANLLEHGWNLITVDIQWYRTDPTGHQYDWDGDTSFNMDGNGRLLPAENRFPSAAGGMGFKPLADYIHAQGLTFGIHMMRGIPRQAVADDLPILGTGYTARDIADTGSICLWNPDMYGVDMTKPGAQDYYDSLFALYASWEVDFIKVDDISRPYNPFQQAEIEAIRMAIDNCGRQVVLSLSPGATPVARGPHVMDHANQWRISDDFWDNWGALYDQFERLHDWTPFRGPGHFPDADMLPLGMLTDPFTDVERASNFTPDEQYLLMSLWSIARSPLIHGGDMTQMDPFTLSLLTNDEAIAVNQRSTHNRQLFRNGDQVAWVADDEDSEDKFLAVFNTGPTTTDVPVELSELGFTGSVEIRSLWEGTDLGSFSGTFSPGISSHGGQLFRLSGVVLPTPWIVAVGAAESGVTVEWEDIPSADSYTLKRGTAEDGPYEVVAAGLTTTDFVDTTGEDRTGYYYVVSATTSGQEGPDSGSRFVVTAGIPETVSWNYDAYATVGGDGAGSTPPVGAVAGAEPAGGWTQTFPANPLTDLRDAVGGATTLDFTYSSTNGGYSIQFSHPGQDADGSWNKEMLNGYLNAGGGGSSRVTLSEVPHGFYDVIIYFSSDVAGRAGTVTDGTTTYHFQTYGPASIAGANAILAPTTDTVGSAPPAANYAVFEGLSGTEQTLDVTIPLYGGIAGFQVVPQPDPLAAVGLEIRLLPDGETAEISWPEGLGATILDESPDLEQWQPMDPQPVGNSVQVGTGDAVHFYRLRRP